MGKLRIFNGAIAAALLLGIMGGKLAAQSQAAELVKQRKKEMSELSRAFEPLLQVVRGQSDDFDAAIASAETMNVNAQKIIENFPAGTGRDAFPESRAKPEVWTQRAEFEAAAQKLFDESKKLVEAAKSRDLEKFQVQFRAYGEACGACHDGPKRSGGKFRYEADSE